MYAENKEYFFNKFRLTKFSYFQVSGTSEIFRKKKCWYFLLPQISWNFTFLLIRLRLKYQNNKIKKHSAITFSSIFVFYFFFLESPEKKSICKKYLHAHAQFSFDCESNRITSRSNENCQHDHCSFNLKRNKNLIVWV